MGGFSWEGSQEKSKRGGREGGGENLCPCDQTTQKLERHKLIKMHSASPRQPLTFSPLCFIPSFSLSHFTSLHHLARLRLMQARREATAAAADRGSLMFLGGCARRCQRSRPPHFLYGGVSDVNEAGWPAGRALVSPPPLAQLFGLSGGAFVGKVLLQHCCTERERADTSEHTVGNLSQQLVSFTSASEVSLLLRLQCYWVYFTKVIQLLTTEYPLKSNRTYFFDYFV